MIYLDNNASTALDPAVREAMTVAADSYGNPSSVHSAGRQARRAVEESRDEVARLIGARSGEIFFTSGGTEANALAILGTVSSGEAGRIVVTAAEHPSVREPAATLAGGFEIHPVAPEGNGALNPARVIDAATPATRLVSVMAANNEYGGIYPVAEIAGALAGRAVPVHTDAVQAAGRVPIDVGSWAIDLLSLSAHKMHGPKGVGALFVRRGRAVQALIPGGGQEKKIRGGTENTIGIVGFGVAARLARERLALEARGIAALRDRLERGILDSISGTQAVGGAAPRLPNTSAVLFEGLAGDALLFRLDLEDVAVSVGSACSSGTLEPSASILSLGIPREQAKGVVRFSLSRLTTEAEVDRVLEILPRIVAEARAIRSRAAAPASVVP